MFVVINSVVLRSLMAGATALTIMLLFGQWFIGYAQRVFASGAREYLPEAHKAKSVTPTMGGVLIGGALLIGVILFGSLTNPYVLLSLGAFIAYGLLGGIDDWYKVRHKSGIYAITKSRLQIVIGLLLMGAWLWCVQPDTSIHLPFFKHITISLWHWYPLFVFWGLFVLTGASNAVNLTDGLDGLATSSLVIVFATFGVIAYCVGDITLAKNLGVTYAPVQELVVVVGAAVGALLGFLWFNMHPARLFMGDVGSLSLGGLLSFIALATKQEGLLALAGLVFVAETVSVMLQVASYRLLKRRLFKMAPLHHHFELGGIPESQITLRFAAVTVVACALALAVFFLS